VLPQPTTAPVDFTADEDGSSASATRSDLRLVPLAGYLATGTALGIVFMQSEVLSWYRIQEMFRFQSFHMYGVIGVAVLVASVTQMLLKRFGVVTLSGDPIQVKPRVRTPTGARYSMGGFVFGLGWALLGACPGPIFTLIGAGYTVYVVPLVAAMAGTWLYGVVKDRLPH
jgi:uncharacterized protein